MKISALILFLAARAGAATFTLTITTTGPTTSMAVVTSSPAGISCPSTCTAVFTASAAVTVSEIHPSTMAFSAWAGTNGCRTNDASCVVTMYGNRNVTAKFNPVLDVSFFGNGLGVVSSSGAISIGNARIYGSTAAQSFVFPAGSVVVLRQSTGPASAFVGWTGDAGCATASTCTITLNGYEHIVASFTASSTTYRLAVTVPLGGGAVTSTPPGIKTSVGVYVSTFAANANVAMATAAATGYRFGGWANGGCAGLTPCVVTSTSPLQGLGGRQSPAAYFFKSP